MRWLEHCAARFTGIEVSGTFYRLPRPSTLQAWIERTPPGFRFALEGHRFVTHFKKLRQVDDAIELRHGSWLDDQVAACLRAHESYARSSLRRWAARTRGWLAEGRDVHVYFDNDAEGAAPHDALALIEMVRQGQIET